MGGGPRTEGGGTRLTAWTGWHGPAGYGRWHGPAGRSAGHAPTLSPNRATPCLTRDWQIPIWPPPRSRESASVGGQQLLGYSRQSARRPVLVLRESAASVPRSVASGGVVGLRTRKARLRTGGATAIPPADTPPHSSPPTPRRPRLSRARSGGGLPFGLWRRHFLGRRAGTGGGSSLVGGREAEDGGRRTEWHGPAGRFEGDGEDKQDVWDRENRNNRGSRSKRDTGRSRPNNRAHAKTRSPCGRELRSEGALLPVLGNSILGLMRPYNRHGFSHLSGLGLLWTMSGKGADREKQMSAKSEPYPQGTAASFKHEIRPVL